MVTWLLIINDLDNALVIANYRRPTFKCVVKRLRFQGDCEFNYCVLGPPGLVPTYVILCVSKNCESGGNLHSHLLHPRS